MTAHRIQTEFEEICLRHEATDKVKRHGYHRFYPYFLAHLRDKPEVRMIEIGVNRSGSLRFWCDYFPNCKFWGVEIRAEKDIEEVQPGAFVVRGDQSDPEFLHRLTKIAGDPVDVIMDDGSHVPSHQLATFDLLFRDALAPGGCYIIEDIETSYWKLGKLYGYEVNYGVGHPKSTIEVMKSIVDCCNAEFQNARYTPDTPISHETQDEIETISFAHNCVIVTKKDRAAHGQYYGRQYGRSRQV